MAESDIGRIVADGVDTMILAEAGAIINSAAANAKGQVGKALSIFAAAYGSSVRRSRGGRIESIHRKSAQEAQAAILTAYRGRSRRNPSESYRQNAPGVWKRDSGGAMERALASPEFFKATGTRLSFIDTAVMDRGARQWYRLNFGAGPAGSATPRANAFPMQILGREAGSLGLGGLGPSGAYAMPAGFWSPSGSGSQFTPIGYFKQSGGAKSASHKFMKGRMSLGFPGYGFLDAGIAVLAESLGAGYSKLADEWFQEAVAKNTGPIAFVVSTDEAAALLPVFESRVEAAVKRGAR